MLDDVNIEKHDLGYGISLLCLWLPDGRVASITLDPEYYGRPVSFCGKGPVKTVRFGERKGPVDMAMAEIEARVRLASGYIRDLGSYDPSREPAPLEERQEYVERLRGYYAEIHRT